VKDHEDVLHVLAQQRDLLSPRECGCRGRRLGPGGGKHGRLEERGRGDPRRAGFQKRALRHRTPSCLLRGRAASHAQKQGLEGRNIETKLQLCDIFGDELPICPAVALGAVWLSASQDGGNRVGSYRSSRRAPATVRRSARTPLVARSDIQRRPTAVPRTAPASAAAA